MRYKTNPKHILLQKSLLFCSIFQGRGGVGKTSMLNSLLDHFKEPNFLGLSIPSSSLQKMINCIVGCMKKSEGESGSGIAKVRKNYLFCIDDVDATKDNEEAIRFIKFFNEHKSWLHNATVSEYKNQAR